MEERLGHGPLNSSANNQLPPSAILPTYTTGFGPASGDHFAGQRADQLHAQWQASSYSHCRRSIVRTILQTRNRRRKKTDIIWFASDWTTVMTTAPLNSLRQRPFILDKQCFCGFQVWAAAITFWRSNLSGPTCAS